MRYLLTRESEGSESLSEGLSRFGIKSLTVPLIEIKSLNDFSNVDRAIREMSQYDWLIFTSANGVEKLLDRAKQIGLRQNLDRVQVASVGPNTTIAVKRFGLQVAMQAMAFTGEQLAREMASAHSISGKRVLLARAQQAQPDLPQILREAGVRVDELAVYGNEIPAYSGKALRALEKSGWVDGVIFASPSAVRRFAELTGADMMARLSTQRKRFRIVSIGPSTSKAICEIGWEADVEAKEHSVPGILQAIRRDLGKSGN